MPCWCDICCGTANDAVVMQCGFIYCSDCYRLAVEKEPMIRFRGSRRKRRRGIQTCPGCNLGPMFPDDGGLYMTTDASLKRPHCTVVYQGYMSEATALQLNDARTAKKVWSYHTMQIAMERNVANLRLQGWRFLYPSEY